MKMLKFILLSALLLLAIGCSRPQEEQTPYEPALPAEQEPDYVPAEEYYPEYYPEQEPDNEQHTPQPKTVQIGGVTFHIEERESVVMPWMRNRIDARWWPDGNMAAIPQEDGRFIFFAANSARTFATTGPLYNPAANHRLTRMINRPPEIDYLAGGPVYTVSDDLWIMLYHAEIYKNRNPQVFNSSLGIKITTNQGASFTDLGIVISSETCFDEWLGEDDFIVEMAGAPFIVHNEYMYVYFRDTLWDRSGILSLGVARAGMDEILAAIYEERTPVFYKFFEGEWNQPGLGGRASELDASRLAGDNNTMAWMDVTYNEYLDMFIMVAALYRVGRGTDTHLYAAVSEDGINWTRFYLIAEAEGEHFYPSIIGENGNALRTVGRYFYIYYTHSIIGAFGRWGDAVLMRSRVTVSG